MKLKIDIIEKTDHKVILTIVNDDGTFIRQVDVRIVDRNHGTWEMIVEQEDLITGQPKGFWLEDQSLTARSALR